MWYKVSDVSTFEYACYRNVGIAISKGNVKNVGGIAARIIDRAEAWFVKYRGTDYIKSIESLAGLDDEGSEERSEERRVGKEGRCRWGREKEKEEYKW